MSEVVKKEDKSGAVSVRVEDDLRQLKPSLEKVTVSEGRTALNTQALNIRKHAEDCLKTVNKQQLVLPPIEDLQKKTISKWTPCLEKISDVKKQRENLPGAPAGEQDKLALNMCLPNKRSIRHQKSGKLLTDTHRKRANEAKGDRIISGSVVNLQGAESKGHHILVVPKEDFGTDSKSTCHEQPVCKTKAESTYLRADKDCTPTETPAFATTSKSMVPRSPQSLPVDIPRYLFTIRSGQIDPMAADFCHFKQCFVLCWSSVVDVLEALQKLLREFAVPLAKVGGERLVELSHVWDSGWSQRYKGEGGIEAAAIHIQSSWRRYLARTAYLCHCRRKWAAGTIAISWLMHAQLCRVRKALQARRFSQLENSRSRAQHLAANWKRIQSFKRTIIHIPSLGYSQRKRLNLRGFDILQNIQMSRLCDIRDENVEVIYICPQHLGNDILDYYTSLLKCDGATDGADTTTARASSSVRRYIILTPEAVDYFPTHNMCLSTLLKYSPQTLKHIRNLIQGKHAYIVGGIAHVDDLAVADELGLPILGPEPAIAQHYSTKSGGRRIFVGAEIDVPPGQGDIYSLNQFAHFSILVKLHETLAELMTQNTDVQRWLFKIDSEDGSHGTAYCDTCHLSCYKWALQEYHRYGPELWNPKCIQETVLLRYLDEIPEWLTHYAQPAKTSCYPNWACFLKTFLRQGGVVEAYPPSNSVTCLTVDLLLEPGGEVTMFSCGDQLHGGCKLEAIGSIVPQSSVHPETLHSICTRVGRACLQRRIVGYVSVDLVTFLDHNTMEKKVWAVDLDITYSNQLAMTQMLLMMTGGTLNCRTGCLEAPMPISEKCFEHQIVPKAPVGNLCAVIGNHLFHSDLSMLYNKVFLMMCKAHGIRFNKKTKQGTVFAFFDSSKRSSIGMITVSEDLQRALATFARHLSVIHQEISIPKSQGETNFMEVIKEIEDILQMTQNKLQREAKPAS
ncbi:IQ motif-containing protein H isoform X3 [Haplochromis burtoni]|uniref:IQ motif-containing protein H isoform X3 n=1 Tax=Haplochromis burtoni TaxID=8153 RepID=UPI0006C9B9E3|nr:IQ motif-containing protein H isoform X3 [Haplochromis burtoni]